METIFTCDDLIIQLIQERQQFKSPCRVMIIVEDERVHLSVGPRDWLWNRKNGELIGSGLSLVSEEEGS